jgi:CelD/BcsL family acetyltransferase involved in cellulose biosynthesis
MAGQGASVPMAASRYETSCHGDVGQLPADALALLSQAERTSMQFGPDWVINFCREVGLPGTEVRLHVLRRDGVVVAVMPLLSRAGGWPGTRRVEALGNYYTALYAPALAQDLAARDLVPLLRAVMANGGRASELRLAPMDPAGREYRLLREALRAAGLVAFGFFSFGNWYLRSDGLTWPAYLGQRNAGLRSTLKRLGKKFAADGGRLEIVTGGARVAEAVAAYNRVYAASWKQPEPYLGFIPGLVATCARRGWLRLGLAWLNDEPVAAQLWIVAHGRADIYKVAYDDGAKQYSPGSLLTGFLMQHVLEEDRVAEVDYLIGDDRYKQVWMNDRRERWGLIAYDPRTPAGLVGLCREGAGRAIKRLRQRLKPPPTPAAAP